MLLGGAAAELLGCRALWLPEARVLAVGDLHLGKAATLRSAGLALPEGSDRDDLERLSRLVIGQGARTLILLGDLVHSPAGWGPGLRGLLKEFSDRLHEVGVEVTLVRGNHDRFALPAELGIREEKHLLREAIEWIHDPAAARRDGPSVAAHLHPRVRLGRRGGVDGPCFWFQKKADTLVLPTYGRDLGGKRWPREAGDRVWICLESSAAAIEVPPSRA